MHNPREHIDRLHFFNAILPGTFFAVDRHFFWNCLIQFQESVHTPIAHNISQVCKTLFAFMHYFGHIRFHICPIWISILCNMFFCRGQALDVFSDDQMAAAMIDRLVHHGHLILFEGNSYRMEHALMKQTARQPGAGAESKDSTLNAKRSGSL